MRFLVALFALLAALATPALADPADVEAASRGVVRVIIIGSDGPQLLPISHGTGFAVGRERIVTNAHVIRQALEDERLAIGVVPADGGEAVYARVVAVSERNDLALLATTSNLGLPPLTVAGNPPTSGAVTAIGYPANVDLAQGLEFADLFRAQPPVTATGFLSGRRPSREMDTLLHTAPIAAGNSGGPLMDECGRVIGVNSFGAESQGSDAEFFFAVSTRELLPFLRANDVSPQMSSGACRSLAALDAEERARRDAEAARVAAASRQSAEELAARTQELRRTAGYAVMDERANGMALAFLALLVATAAGLVAAWFHVRQEMRHRAVAGALALAALVGAVLAWFTRPPFEEIDRRVEDALHEEAQGTDSGTIVAGGAGGGDYTCTLDESRSRVTGAPAQDLPFAWREDGCVNGRTQYGRTDGTWARVFVPANEAAVSVNLFDPASSELSMERYLLGREAMTEARTARGGFTAPQCGASEDEARAFGTAQDAVTAALPSTPNERLVYRCAASAPEG